MDFIEEYRFSIIIVCFNANGKLKKTIDSIISQDYKNYQIVIKDGGSEDGTLDCLSEYEGKNIDIKVEVSPDQGIYDAMNQAVSLCDGDYIYFLNTGDYFENSKVLATVNKELYLVNWTHFEGPPPHIVYGNILDRTTGKVVMSNPKINGFALYRNVPCHQACFYQKRLLTEHPFNTEYKVRADYEHFLWCCYEKKAKTYYVDKLIADYEGGGYSAVNVKISKVEHKIITEKYMSSGELFKYRMILALTLSPLRTKMAESKLTAGFYNGLKSLIYKLRK